MNNNLRALYVAIVDNEVICFDTNLKDFYEQLKKLKAAPNNYQWLYRHFKKNIRFPLTYAGKEYYFQKLV